MKCENEMSLARFLTKYVLLCGEDLKKLTHDDVKVLFPQLRRSSFEELEREYERVAKIKSENDLEGRICDLEQRIVLVNDGHRTIPYYVPEMPNYSELYTEFNYEEEPSHEEVILEHYDYMSMSNYDLKKLLKSKFNTRRNKLNARHELEDRGVIMKKTRDKKEKYKENYYGEY